MRCVVHIFLVFLPVFVFSASDTDEKCLNYQFLCKNGRTCIDKISICDGLKDCPDGSDEIAALCSKTLCPKENFRCNYGACVSLSAKCDGRVDCADKSDEENPDCPVVVNKVPTTKCSSTEYQCTSGKCLAKIYVCDGSTQCADGSDETVQLCANNKCPNKFRCDYGGCVANDTVCDGQRNCADGSDEFFNLCKDSNENNNNHGTTPAVNEPSEKPAVFFATAPPDYETTVNSSSFNVFEESSSNSYNTEKQPTSGFSYAAPADPPNPVVSDQSENPLKSISIFVSSANKADVSIAISTNTLTQSWWYPSNGGNTYNQSSSNTVYSDPPQTVQTQPLSQLPVIKQSQPTSSVGNSPSKRGSCYLPEGIGRTYTIHCPTHIPNCEYQNLKESFVNVSYVCSPGYLNTKHYSGESQCLDSYWRPEITPCLRTCPTLHPINMDLRCTFEGEPVDCKGSLVEGTKVRPRCAPHFQTISNYDTIECQSNGKWTNDLFECIPECGTIYKNKAKGDGDKTEFGEAPWFTAVYRKDNSGTYFSCGGTIITPYLVLSAAHCFYDNSRNVPYKPENFVVAVSKYSRQYNTRDNQFTKIYSVEKIILPDEYTGDSTFFAADVALLRIKEEISLSEAVLPACIRWASNYDSDNSVFNLHGQGFVNDDGSASSFLVTSRLAYISRVKCLENVTVDIHQVIPVDKFCALSGQGQGAHEGDSGGGFLYTDPVTGKYFLLGVVSNGDERDKEKTLLTDIRKYILWLDKWRTEVQREMKMRLSSDESYDNLTRYGNTSTRTPSPATSTYPSTKPKDNIVFPGSAKSKT